jgi:FAD/FMN-containing dehydrogenase
LVPGLPRRDFLSQGAGLLLVAAIDMRSVRLAAAPSAPAVLRGAAFLAPKDGDILRRQSGPRYSQLSTYYNRRFECVRPAIMIYCRSPRAVGQSIRWCRENGMPFAVRSGGHCYEGTSRSDHVVIDLRGLDTIELDPELHLLSVGGGALLGKAYATAARAAQAVAGGTCPTIGVAGHALAGGLGFFVRQFGLACDNIASMEIANADGDIGIADEKTNPDLFWALRGAGQSSFGVVTQLAFRTHDAPHVTTFELEATASRQRSARFLSRWQSWMGEAPDSLSSSTFVQRKTSGSVTIQFRGTVLGSDTVTRRQLEQLARELVDYPRFHFRELSFGETVRWFSEGEDGRPVYEKGKSDIVKQSLGTHEFQFIVDELPPEVDGELTALGGAAARLSADQSAFPHRSPTDLVIQWGISWERPQQARSRLAILDEFYSRIRPLMSASAFLNYVDREVPDPARAYWGTNLERLVAVKQKFDPNNVFRHAMSVPIRLERDGSAAPTPQSFCRER